MLLLRMVTLVIAGIGLTACAPDDNRITEGQNSPTVSTTAEELQSDYENNQIYADQKYMDKQILISGMVDQIMSNAVNKPEVLLSTQDQFNSVHATGLSVDFAASLSKGQRVTLKCIGGGVILGSPFLNHCVDASGSVQQPTSGDFAASDATFAAQSATSTAHHAKTTANEDVSCSTLDHSKQESMEALALRMGREDGTYTRFEEDLASDLCEDNTAAIDDQVDSGYITNDVAVEMAKILGKSYVPTRRTSNGLAYQAALKAFSDMGLCSACASNVADHFSNKPDSKCGKLAQRALAGDESARTELASFPDYCDWNH